ncbi:MULTISPECIES: NAD(P)-dependent oxidoreductase [unclassified Oceanispirochaeta]|uniref:NAD(P)-dependent oxidoreductase n=1 Tax=unclassified Oceanispirochaeta TaxID=2635722 RepID=UPI00149540CA|nr:MULTISPECIES: NAD(P)-dependent oxidoreductase [unclassified Oceanispirochaeta]MBF9014913.1 NAD(P)-dependent oxidoreductase [Oceanispirochaeta sp. M2]
MNIKNIAWIGTGVMGRSMCLHLMDKGYEISVYNRTKSKADDLIAAGAKWCDSPGEAASGADVIFTIVGYPKDVETVILGENGVLDNAKKGAVIVDMTTSEPSLAVKIAEKAAAVNVGSIDAPVSGGDLGARNGTLAIMCGGDKNVFDTVLPLMEAFGKNIKLMGAAGAGQHTKMCNQILIATNMIGVVESLLYGHKAGMDMNEIIDVIGSGAAASWSINNLGRRIADGNFDPGFFIKHFVKDMGIALKEAQAMNLSLPGLAMANQFYTAAMAQGLQDMGTQGLYKVFEGMNSPG